MRSCSLKTHYVFKKTIYRTRLLLDVLFRSRDVEKSGTGFQRVNEYCNQQNIKWSFRKEAYGFFFEFFRLNVPQRVPQNVPQNSITGSNNGRSNRYSEEEIKSSILKLVTENPKISRRAIGEKLGISSKTVGRKIGEMTNITYDGRERNGSWKVSK